MPPKIDPKKSKAASETEDTSPDTHTEDAQITTLLKTLIDQGAKQFKITQELLTAYKDSSTQQISALQDEIFRINQGYDTLSAKFGELESRLIRSEERNKELETQLGKANDALEEQALYTRRPCLVINNLKSSTAKSDEELFIDKCNEKMPDINMSSDKIAKIQTPA